VQQYALYSNDDEQTPGMCIETDDNHLRATICGVYDCQNLSKANGQLLNRTILYAEEDGGWMDGDVEDGEIYFYDENRILTLAKFLIAAALPLMLSALIVAIYRQYIFPNLLQ